jgi:uncharacterized protein YjiS (DUF1127 family)
MTQTVSSVPAKRRSASLLQRAWQSLLRWRDIRSSVRTLRRLDNRMLRDVGIDRYDIEEVVRGRIRR